MQIRLVLDTNIYRKDPFRKSQDFITLGELCKAEKIHLLLPEIIKREFETHLDTENAKSLSDFKKANGGILALPMPDDLRASLNAVHQLFKDRKDDLVASSALLFKKWSQEVLVETLPLTGAQAVEAMNNYFKLEPPFKTLKNRDDIPDAMIYQQIAELAKQGVVTFVSMDENLREATKIIENINCYKNLREFIASIEVQALIIKNDVLKKNLVAPEHATQTEADEVATSKFGKDIERTDQNIKAILAELIKLSTVEGNGLSDFISSKGGEGLPGTNFYSPSIPGDDKEGYIYMYGDLENIEYDWDQASYHGDMTFTVPFSGNGYFNINYFVPRWAAGDLEKRHATYTEHNDYVVEADEEVNLAVTGMLRIVLEADYSVGQDLEEAIEEMTIDSLDNVRLAEDVE